MSKNTFLKKVFLYDSNDYENAKLKSAEIKLNNNEIDYLKWYDDEYTPQLLKKTLNVRTNNTIIITKEPKETNAIRIFFLLSFICSIVGIPFNSFKCIILKFQQMVALLYKRGY